MKSLRWQSFFYRPESAILRAVSAARNSGGGSGGGNAVETSVNISKVLVVEGSAVSVARQS